MAEAYETSKLKCSIEHQSSKMQNYIYSPGSKVLVWRKKAVNNRIEKIIGQFSVLNRDECPKIFAIDQEGAIKRYSTSQIIAFLEQPSMLNDSITECKIKDRYVKQKMA